MDWLLVLLAAALALVGAGVALGRLIHTSEADDAAEELCATEYRRRHLGGGGEAA